ncbi:MAG: hypothetical protein ACTTGJ_02225 [Clostridium sp.]
MKIYKTSSFNYDPEFTIVDDSECPDRFFQMHISIDGRGYNKKEKQEKLKEAFLEFLINCC